MPPLEAKTENCSFPTAPCDTRLGAWLTSDIAFGRHTLCKPTFANPGKLSTTTTRLLLGPGRTGATRS